MNTCMFAHAQCSFLLFAKNACCRWYMRTCDCVRSAWWVCTGASKHVDAHFYRAIYNESWALISFCDIYVPACHCIFGYTLTIHPPYTIPYYNWTQHSPCPLSQATNIGGDSPPFDHGRAVATPTIGGQQRRLCFSCSPLPALCSAKTSRLALYPHNTLACNHTSLQPPPRPHPCTS